MANSDNDDVTNDEFASADSDQEDPTVSGLSAGRTERLSDAAKPSAESNDVINLPAARNASEQPAATLEEPKAEEHQMHIEKPPAESDIAAGASKEAPPPAKTWGWGGWGSFWSSVSTVTESAQALGHRVIVSVEDTLGLPSNEDATTTEKEDDEMTKKLAEEAVEHDVPLQNKPVQLEPTATPTGSVPGQQMEHGEQDLNREERESGTEEQHSTLTGLTGFLSGFAAAIQTTGKDLVAGGLDALELLGKKTIDVISEGDKGLLKKRTLIGGGATPTLSQLLREAKATSDKPAEGTRQGEGSEQQSVNYSFLFEEYQGIAHLEALELLSRECEGKVELTLSGLSAEELATVQKTLQTVTHAFNLEELQGPEDSSDSTQGLLQVIELFSDVTLPLRVDKLTKVSAKWRATLEDRGKQSKQDVESGVCEGDRGSQDIGEASEGCANQGGARSNGKQVVYEDGLRSLAELTSSTVELFRKMAELALLPQGQEQDLSVQAKRFNRLTNLVSVELESLASLHAETITKLDPQNGNTNTTSLYLEASNSCSYVQDAFQLLCPILKFSALKKKTC